MARYYGTIQGARGPASRLGHASGGLSVTAQSFNGDIVVHLYAPDHRSSTDYVEIIARPHGGGQYTTLYNGKISDLLGKGGQDELIRRMAERKLAEAHYKAALRDE
jgi:hypothetical protein